MRQSRAMTGAIVLVTSAACAGSGTPPDTAVPAPPAPPASDAPGAAPWSRAALSPDAVPAAYIEAWQQAANRSRCALIAPASTATTAAATARRAQFGGGWGVAYDLADQRSAFGVAGTGVSASAPSYEDWPHERSWRDGSTARYGPEGGAGPNQLAYLRITGQECLYNVWSRLGRLHLELLLDELRLVATG
jgi:hypothetical protein